MKRTIAMVVLALFLALVGIPPAPAEAYWEAAIAAVLVLPAAVAVVINFFAKPEEKKAAEDKKVIMADREQLIAE